MKSYLASFVPLALQGIISGTLNSTQLPIPTTWTMEYPQAPAWKEPLEQALAAQPVTFYQLATVAGPLTPHVRTVTNQGFFGEKPSEDPAHPAIKTDSLFFTTHAGSQKIHDLTNVSSAYEAVLYIPSASQQFRVRGHATVLSPGSGTEVMEDRARGALATRFALAETWNWGNEIQRIWEGLDKFSKNLYPTTEDGSAPAGFRIVVLVPDEVEVLKMKEGKTVGWKAQAGKWTEAEIVEG